MNTDVTKVNPLDLRHDQKRPNLAEGPIAEVSDLPQHPDGVYDRLRKSDPDAPVLVWKGKPAQDAEPMVVPTAPLVVQEHVTPEAILKGLPRRDGQIPLFDEPAALEEDKRYEAYRHEWDWKNRLILGDSLRVMQSLAEAENLRGQVQCVYVDPPYGIKFGSNWQSTVAKRDVKDNNVGDSSREPEVIQAFRDTWDLGVNSYLSYLRDRMLVAYDLLKETGSLFLQIGDENMHRVRALLDEVFGAENCLGLITILKTTSATNSYLPLVADYVLWYAKDKPKALYNPLYRLKVAGGDGARHYSLVEEPDGTRRTLTKQERSEGVSPGNRLFAAADLQSAADGREKGEGAACWFAVPFQGRVFYPDEKNRWKTNEEGMERLALANRLFAQKKALRYVRYLDDFPAYSMNNVWTDVGGAGDKVYVVQTSETVVERCLLMASNPGDLVLDPTCGSGTTAVVAEQWARRWITIDTSRVALTVARQRLMAARYPWYLLADSPEGAAKASAVGLPAIPAPHTGDVRAGFVCEVVPHVTLKSIANNPRICEGMTANEIDQAVRSGAEPEVLVDRPYADNRRVRVTGPFSVESLIQESGRGGKLVAVSTAESDLPATEQLAAKDDSGGTFETRVIDFLRKEGIVNPDDRSARVAFDSLEAVGDPDLSATGTYTDAAGRHVRAAILIAPESRAVTRRDVRAAARAAIQGVGHEALFVLAFGFEPDVAQGKQGDLFVYPVRLGHELQFGDKTLKKTGTGGLFTLFGDPDVRVEKMPDGRLRARLEGLDVYNPMTRASKSVDVSEEAEDDDDLDAIAAWFVDTAYDGTAFHVRQAYFLGSKNPYERLKKALKAEIDESAFENLVGPVGQPFPRPESGRVAVKVINHYGDEAFRVVAV